MSWMAGNWAPVMRWAVFTTRWSALGVMLRNASPAGPALKRVWNGMM